MSESLLIRPVEPGDRPAWQVLWEGYNAFYGRSGASALPEAVTEATWARFLEPAEPMHAFVAEQEGALLGLAHVVVHRSTTQLDPVGYLQDLFTAEAARGRGVGRSLIEAVYRWAVREGLARVYWQTHESNAPARRLYDTLADRPGFVIYRKQLQEPR